MTNANDLLREIRRHNSSGLTKDMQSRIDEVLALQSEPVEPTPIVDALSFVQPVPDHCDRIVWRERYYHLPLVEKAEPAPAQDEREASHAPAWYGAAEAEAWAAGFNACLAAAPIAQTEQQPVAWRRWQATNDGHGYWVLSDSQPPISAEPLYATRPAQTEQQPAAIPEAVRAWMMDVPLPDNEYGYRLTNRRDELLAAPIAQTDPPLERAALSAKGTAE